MMGGHALVRRRAREADPVIVGDAKEAGRPMYEDRRDARDPEWRLVASERHRMLARAATRRRARVRLIALVLGVAAAVTGALFATIALSAAPPSAQAVLAIVGDEPQGMVVASASKDDNERVVEMPGAGGAATWGGGRAGASSCVQDGALISNSTVSIVDASLAGGRVTAVSIELVASAAATRTAISGGVDASRVEGLQVDGRDVVSSELPLTIEGLGTLSALEREETGTDDALQTQVTGLRLHLDQPWEETPAGTDLIVGSASAGIDRATSRRLVPVPAPGEDPEGAEDSDDDSSDDSSGGGSSSGGAPSAAGSSAGWSDGGTAAGSPSADGRSPGAMPAPGRVKGDLLSFAGAVFPVSGEVWYMDDYGVLRAGGERHTGVDIFARRGTPLVAVQTGVVTELRYRSLGGNSFHLENDTGDYFYYAHLLRYASGIVEGVAVEAGQVLGYVGNTGNAISTPPHVHFEIHPSGGDPVNPFPYLELWRGAELPASGDATSEEGAQAWASQGGAPGVTSPEAMLGRHERAVTVAGVSPRRVPAPGGSGDLVPAAVSFGLAGGLVTSAVYRRRSGLYLLDIDLGTVRGVERAIA